jgi:hypothetical protein
MDGVDTSTVCNRGTLDCLAGAGCSFVFRYYARGAPAKLLTRLEAEQISSAGLMVGAVWESGSPTNVGYFDKAKGQGDGRVAYCYARDTIIQPAGSAIYFAVDYDASDGDIAGPITDYFSGVVDSFRTEGLGNPAYKVAVYGSGATCQAMIAAGLVDFSWLAQSTGWAGYKTFKDWNLKQGPESSQCGIDVDSDQARGAFGGFQVGARAIREATVGRAKGATKIKVEARRPRAPRRPVKPAVKAATKRRKKATGKSASKSRKKPSSTQKKK